jgi:hypothetical protein
VIVLWNLICADTKTAHESGDETGVLRTTLVVPVSTQPSSRVVCEKPRDPDIVPRAKIPELAGGGNLSGSHDAVRTLGRSH